MAFKSYGKGPRRTDVQHLQTDIQNALNILRDCADSCDGPADLRQAIYDLDDYPELDQNAAANYAIGILSGASSACQISIEQLIDVLGLTWPVREPEPDDDLDGPAGDGDR